MSIAPKFLQLARLYKLLETHLREQTLTSAQLLAKDDIKDCASNMAQIKNCLVTLRSHGHVRKLGTFADARYQWVTGAPSFTIGTRHKPAKPVRPSPLVVETQATPEATEVRQQILSVPVAPPKEIELVIGRSLIILGVNEATGRIRLVVEDSV